MEKLMKEIFEKTGNIEAFLYLKEKDKFNIEASNELMPNVKEENGKKE